jgi:hypothetical protein
MVIQLKQPGLAEVLRGLSGGLDSFAKQRAEQQKQSMIQSILNGSYGQTNEGMIHPGETPGLEIQGDATQRESYTDQQIQAMALINPQVANLMQRQRQTDVQENQEIRKRNLELFDDTSKKIQSLDEELTGIKQLEKLSDKIGKEQGQDFFSRFFRTYRFDPETGGFTKIGRATSTPQEERYLKLIADATKTIKNDYGARITNLDMQVFLRRFPDLMMTPEGRKEIFETMRDYKQAKLLYNQALKQQLRATRGKVDPYSLDEKVEAKIGPQLESIRKRMVERGLGPQENVKVKEEAAMTPSGEQQTEQVTIVNPQTGQRLMLKEGQWVPAQ